MRPGDQRRAGIDPVRTRSGAGGEDADRDLGRPTPADAERSPRPGSTHALESGCEAQRTASRVPLVLRNPPSSPERPLEARLRLPPATARWHPGAAPAPTRAAGHVPAAAGPLPPRAARRLAPAVDDGHADPPRGVLAPRRRRSSPARRLRPHHGASSPPGPVRAPTSRGRSAPSALSRAGPRRRGRPSTRPGRRPCASIAARHVGIHRTADHLARLRGPGGGVDLSATAAAWPGRRTPRRARARWPRRVRSRRRRAGRSAPRAATAGRAPPCRSR